MKAVKQQVAAACIAVGLCGMVPAQQVVESQPGAADTDHDGLSDALEQQLLARFVPKFMVGADDCSVLPAEFMAGVKVPQVRADNGTIYGQATPAQNIGGSAATTELHFYHLWRKDCGGHGHPLDTEHVAVLIRSDGAASDAASWKAVYWYAGAHENTVCDVSQIARASTLHAEDHGATVWISPGKHASYLNETLCRRGCGADRCEKMTELVPAHLINLGEAGSPMNESVFISSAAWPLRAKMQASNFPAVSLARLNELPQDDIAWVNPGRHPVQGIIAKSSGTEQALAASGANTASAISVAGSSTDSALADAGSSTGNALQKSYSRTRHALGTTVRHVGKALHRTPSERSTNSH